MFNTEDVIVYIGGAGAGKTSTLMEELKKALTIYRPDEVAFVAFSRRAAKEARDRAGHFVLNFDEDNYPYFKTLHALTYMLNDYSSQGKKIIGVKEAKYFSKVTPFKINVLNREEIGERDNLGQTCFDLWSLERSTGKKPTPKEMPSQQSYRDFVFLYNEFKKQNNLVDYHDCLSDYLSEGRTLSKIKFAIIDEAQDLTLQQWNVCFKMFEEAKSIRISGDDYQAIFTFQGSEPKMLIELANKYKLIKIEESHRLPIRVAKLANVISDKLKDKVDKNVISVKKEEGNIKFLMSIEFLCVDILTKPEEKWFILARANYMIKEATEVFKEKLILFHYSNGFVLPEKYLKRINQYYRWKKDILKPDSNLNFCKKYKILGEEWKDWWETELIENIEMRNLIRLYERKYGFEHLWKKSFSAPDVLVTTVFKVKGGECENVAILTASTRKIESSRYEDKDNELRILYTAVTRSKKNLYLVESEADFSMFDRIKLYYEESK